MRRSISNYGVDLENGGSTNGPGVLRPTKKVNVLNKIGTHKLYLLNTVPERR